MNKQVAIELLGGTPTSVAREIGISAQAVAQWPQELPQRIKDRVLAALARKHLPPELLAKVDQPSGAAMGVQDAV